MTAADLHRSDRAWFTSPRPTGHPLWKAFYVWVKTQAKGVNPAIVDTDKEFGINGWLIFQPFCAGYDVGKFEALARDRGGAI